MLVEDSLETIEQAARGNARLEAVTQELAKEGIVPGVLDTFLMYAFHPGITFGIANFTEPSHEGTEPITPVDLFRLCNDLSSRNLTGNAARQAIYDYLLKLNPKARKWVMRLLKRDLRIDFGLKDANKALKAAKMPTIPVFEVPLAKSYDDVKKMEGEWAIQPKYDGARVVTRITPDGEVTLFSRSGHEWKGFPSVKNALKELAENLKHDSWLGNTLYLDGEVVTYVNGKIDFQTIQKILMRDDGLEIGELKYVVFDVAYESEWFDSKTTYRQRYTHAQFLLGEGNSKISLVPTVFEKSINTQMLEAYCEKYADQGYEGAMARKLDKTVELKRSTSLLKVKTFQTEEFEIVGVVEGTGKYVGMMGTLVCKTKDGKQFEIGTGFSDKDREDYFNPCVTVGRLASCRFQGLTNDGVPRIPSFRGLRSKNDL